MAVKVFAAQLLEEPVAASLRTGCWADDAKPALTTHWQEFIIEAVCLGNFMISGCSFSALLEHPASPVRASVMSVDIRRFLVGLAMGLTAMLLIYSPVGQRSGAHMNPATTLTFYRLGKVEGWDAFLHSRGMFCPGLERGATAERTLHQSNHFTASHNRCEQVRSGTTLRSGLMHFSPWLAAETGVNSDEFQRSSRTLPKFRSPLDRD